MKVYGASDGGVVIVMAQSEASAISYELNHMGRLLDTREYISELLGDLDKAIERWKKEK